MSSSNMTTGEKFQPLVCKKCGEDNLYHPKEDVGNWPRIDKFGNVQAFEQGFDVPHWYICPSSEQSNDHRARMVEEMSQYQRREFLKREDRKIQNTPIHPPGQQKLPSEKLTPLDRDIAAKLVVMEMCLEDIKRLLAQKAQSDI